MDFEKAFEKKFAVKHAFAFSYGRTGLFALLKALGIKDAEVICPAYTCVVVPHAIVLSGNIPVFVDCGKNSFNMDYDGIERAITEKTKAIIVTHLFGFPMDCERIQDIANKSNQRIYLIHDCAHSFGAKWNNRCVWEYGDAALFAFGIGKLMSSLYGGVITVEDDEVAKALREERNEIENSAMIIPESDSEDERRRRTLGQFRRTVKAFGRFLYLMSVKVGFNSHIYPVVKWFSDNTRFLKGWTDYYQEDKIEFPEDASDPMLCIEARIGIEQLRKYDDIVQKRIERAQKYEKAFSNEEYQYPRLVNGATYSHYPLVVDNRMEWKALFRERGIELGELIEYSIPDMPAYSSYVSEQCPNSTYLSNHVINIPIACDIDIDRVTRSDLQSTFDTHWDLHKSTEIAGQKVQNAEEFFRPVRSVFDEPSGDVVHVLDVGCGDGAHCECIKRFAGKHVRYTGVDISRSCIESLKAKYGHDPRFEFYRCDACNLPFSNNAFDVVFSYGVLGYTDSPQKALSELHRVTKDKGMVGLWVYPHREGLGGMAFRAVRRTCAMGGQGFTSLVANLIVPFLYLLPTASKIHLGNATWGECKEIVMVNIAPEQLYFFKEDELAEWWRDCGLDVCVNDQEEPITFWGTKRAS